MNLLWLPEALVCSNQIVRGVSTMDTHLKSVGLDNMPSKWYQQAQLALWPHDEPCDPFLHCGMLWTIENQTQKNQKNVVSGNLHGQGPHS